MARKSEDQANGQTQHVKVLCIDNHASSTYCIYLLRRCGYEVDSAGFLCDALELIRRKTYDVFLINDELARAGKELLKKFREAAGAIPIVYYSTVVYPFSPRLADQSGSTLETPVAVTEAAIAVARAIAHLPTRMIASRRAA